jgi:hypothetical protein
MLWYRKKVTVEPPLEVEQTLPGGWKPSRIKSLSTSDCVYVKLKSVTVPFGVCSEDINMFRWRHAIGGRELNLTSENLTCDMAGLCGDVECNISLLTISQNEYNELALEHAATGFFNFTSIGEPGRPVLIITLYCLSDQMIRDMMICQLGCMVQKSRPEIRLIMTENNQFPLEDFDENFWERRFYIKGFRMWFEARFG